MINIHLPNLGTTELEVTEIMVNVGDNIQVEQPLITVEGEKVSMEIPAPCSGVVKEIKIAIGDIVNTGTLIMMFENTLNKDPLTSSKSLMQLKNTNFDMMLAKKQDITKQIYATPLIRHIAHEFNINLAKIKGTGRKGRILRNDIKIYIRKSMQYLDSLTSNNNINSITETSICPKSNFIKFGDIEEVELHKNQKIAGTRLHHNWITIPHVTQFNEVDITELETFRKQQNIEVKNKQLNVKITLLVFIIKAVAKALEQHPYFNSSLSEDKEKLILKKYINISVAINTSNGVLVPIMRNVNKKGIIDLSHELVCLSQKARANKLTASDLQGGCFTISSLGGISGTAFTPIVNAPEIAILGVSTASIKPIWNGKEFDPKLMLPLSLSYNLRVINGVDGAQFIGDIGNLISDIRLLLM